jgi:hypothetical protein
MTRSSTPPPAEPKRGADADVPFYRFDPNLGSPRDIYQRADVVHPNAQGPEVAGKFVANVEGETFINTMWGRKIVAWRAEPGTQCIILGYWLDGTVHLRWPAISGHYRVDGRFPAWVVAADPTAKLAGGGLMLLANNPPVPLRGLQGRVLIAAIGVIVLVVLLLVPPARDAVGNLASDLLRIPR